MFERVPRVGGDLLQTSGVARAPRTEDRSAGAKAEPALRLVSASDGKFPDELYERLAPVVNKLLWTMLGPDPERDDLAHEIFIRLLKSVGELRDPARLEAWARRVAVNFVKNEFRRRKLRRLFVSGVDEELAGSYHPDFEGRELLLRTYRVLSQLPPRERVPLTLRLVGQQSVEEIAGACATSVRTVKRRLKGARERFLRLASADPLLAERLRCSKLDEGTDD
jgi:RNA polymerase sigma-70 factor (ECF subfamily)